jgi:putative membrane protein
MKNIISSKLINRVFVIYYLVGIAGLSIPYTRELFRPLIGISLLMSLVLLMFFHKSQGGRFWLAVIFVVVGGYLFEWIGVNTGLIFGHYAYGKVLGPGFMGTPYLIGFNWLMLIYLVSALLQKVAAAPATKWFLGASLMVGYDVFLEPVAQDLGMWGWSNNAVPVQNYLAWYLLSFLFLAIFDLLKVKFENAVALTLLACQIGFFVALNILNQIPGL